jgi:excisionase family DNA binding protein
MENDKLLPPREVARLLGVDPKTVSRWAETGKIPSIKTPGGHRRYRKSVVDAILNGEAVA